MAANGICTVALILMLVNDDGFKRKIFFYCYMFSTLFQYIYGVYEGYSTVDDKEPWKQACDDINRKGELNSIHASNLDECHETIKNVIHATLAILYIMTGILYIHFFSVVYSHWKNYDEEQAYKARTFDNEV